ncbi:hypothetical protein GG804_11130 [Sphingomonas histidinilytica]|jgi:hypothetical protein|uniref:Uncharacterized protein n=1 Tax=Rhizorhabdus histidinilytica TaxID=439228 RepID=A0A1T5AA42_9SPHN|nr:hypothetical protein [Rhizorhabdus histidinilytica]MBO9377320.1 hypothetical protein [Rhizorhabdus histidinilytica]QEH78166.1 hypothetical protein EIK56_08335 [Sphingomonas sp. C8-2]SKB31543.1 hypothetical protein SAMN06295920_101744 [Rhizorhabdus histidinilytica]
MLQLLSFALFSGVFLISIAAITATIRSEMPYILRALGIAPSPTPPLRPIAERRVRVIRQVQVRPAVSAQAWRAAA